MMRAVLFAFGMLVLLIAFIFLIPFASSNSAARVFATIDAAVLYTLALGPVLLGGVFEALSSGRKVTPSIGFAGVGMWIYTPITLVVIALLVGQKDPPLSVLLIVQLVALFVLCTALVLGTQVSDQVEAVEAAEQTVLAPIADMRRSAEQLAITVSEKSLPEGDASRQLVQDARRLADELAYLSPSASQETVSLEKGIQSHISAALACLGDDEVEPHQVQNASKLVHDALTLLARRKAIRN